MIVEMQSNEAQGYDTWDGCYGTVVSRCKKGVYLTLDNGEDAFAYKFGNLWPGTKVLCTVRRMAEGERLKLVTIDSVISYPMAA